MGDIDVWGTVTSDMGFLKAECTLPSVKRYFFSKIRIIIRKQKRFHRISHHHGENEKTRNKEVTN